MNNGEVRVCYGVYEWIDTPAGFHAKFRPGAHKHSGGWTKPDDEDMSSFRRVAIAWNSKGQIGISICNPLDNFRKKVARDKAVGRLKRCETLSTDKHQFLMSPTFFLEDQSHPINRCWKPIQEYVKQRLEKGVHR